MKKLQMPSSYTMLSAQEQRSVRGGSEWGDAFNSFWDNLHLDEFFYDEDGMISISFTYVPTLLLNAVKAGVISALTFYDEVTCFLGLRTETNDYIRLFIKSQQPQGKLEASSQTSPFLR